MKNKSFKIKEFTNENILDEESVIEGNLSNTNEERILNQRSIFSDDEDYYFSRKNQETVNTFEEILTIFKSTYIINEPEVPFPQADLFEVFVEICEELYQRKALTKNQIMDIFNLNPRQYSFYMAAGEYLGLINRRTNSNERSLSQIGLGVFSLNIKQRNLAIVKLILQHKPFHDVFALYLENNQIPNTNQIFEVLKRNEIYNVNSDVTLKRRATSVRSWIKWIVNLYED